MAPERIDVDIAICGAGPVGLALAAFLVRRGVQGERIALIDGKSLGQAITDPRSIALSWGSVQLLEEVRAWPLPATPIHEIHVSRRGQLGRSLMDRAEHRLPALGYVARYGDVVDALARACEAAGVRTLRPARVESFDEEDGAVLLRLDDGRIVEASVAVQAEGGVFGQQESKARQRDYEQTALIARVTVNEPIAHRAFERFTDEGPLALLPQDGGDGHGYALVWCMRPERAVDIQLLDDTAFLRELGDAFGTRLGAFTAASPRVAFPLGLNAEARATDRTVAIGNAAQAIAPAGARLKRAGDKPRATPRPSWGSRDVRDVGQALLRSAIRLCPAVAKARSISVSRFAQPWKAFCQCVKDRPAWARAKVGSSRTAVSKKCRARSLSALLKRYMCHRPR